MRAGLFLCWCTVPRLSGHCSGGVMVSGNVDEGADGLGGIGDEKLVLCFYV